MKVKIKGGVTHGINDVYEQFFTSSHSLVGHPEDVEGYDNVKRVMNVLTEDLMLEWTN